MELESNNIFNIDFKSLHSEHLSKGEYWTDNSAKKQLGKIEIAVRNFFNGWFGVDTVSDVCLEKSLKALKEHFEKEGIGRRSNIKKRALYASILCPARQLDQLSRLEKRVHGLFEQFFCCNLPVKGSDVTSPPSSPQKVEAPNPLTKESALAEAPIHLTKESAVVEAPIDFMEGKLKGLFNNGALTNDQKTFLNRGMAIFTQDKAAKYECPNLIGILTFYTWEIGGRLTWKVKTGQCPHPLSILIHLLRYHLEALKKIRADKFKWEFFLSKALHGLINYGVDFSYFLSCMTPELQELMIGCLSPEQTNSMDKVPQAPLWQTALGVLVDHLPSS